MEHEAVGVYHRLNRLCILVVLVVVYFVVDAGIGDPRNHINFYGGVGGRVCFATGNRCCGRCGRSLSFKSVLRLETR